MVEIHPKNGRRQMAQRSARVDVTREEEERNTESYMNERNSGRNGRKRSGRTEKNGDWESKDVSNVKTPVNTYIQMHTQNVFSVL
jgi:hypothetical protein